VCRRDVWRPPSDHLGSTKILNERAVAVATIVADSGVVARPGDVQRDRLIAFRDGWYRCLTRWTDTLFEMGDALLAAGPVASLPYLSLEPSCRRGWGSVYAALVDGRVDVEAARDLLAEHLPGSWWPVFAVDVTAWARPEASCSPRRGMCHVPDPGGDRRGRSVPGWAYQWVVQVSERADSWTAPADVVRVDPHGNANEVAGAQMRALAGRLARLRPAVVPVFCLDAGYCPITATMAVAAEGVDHPARVVVRIRRDRVFYFDPPSPAGPKPGRRKVHGDRFDCADPTTWPEPHDELDLVDGHYGPVSVQAWHGVHPKPGKYRRWGRQNTTSPRSGVTAPVVRGTVVRISLPRRESDGGHTMWLWTAGPDPVDLDLIWRAYLRRFAIEHTNRFLKQQLSWNVPALRTPEQADRWSWIVAAAYTQLHLAKPLVVDVRLPWEKHLTAAGLTPTRVRRSFRVLAARLPTPAKPRKPTRPGPGRPAGSRNRQPTTHHKVIIKGRRRYRKR
jgi:DDE superfamily endonuclease